MAEALYDVISEVATDILTYHGDREEKEDSVDVRSVKGDAAAVKKRSPVALGRTTMQNTVIRNPSFSPDAPDPEDTQDVPDAIPNADQEGGSIITAVVLTLLIISGIFIGLYLKPNVQDSHKPTQSMDTPNSAGQSTCSSSGLTTVPDLMSKPTKPIARLSKVPLRDPGSRVRGEFGRPYTRLYVRPAKLDSPGPVAVRTVTTGPTVPLDRTGWSSEGATLTSTSHSTPRLTLPPTTISLQEYSSGNVKPEKTVFGGYGKEPGKLRSAAGVAVSADNEIFVSEIRNKRVQVFNKNGVSLRLFPTIMPGKKDKIMYPHDVDVDKDRHAWVVGKSTDSSLSDVYVVQYSRDGQPLSQIDIQRHAVSPKIAIDERNNKIIVLALDKISIYQPNGSFDRSFGKDNVNMKYVTTGREGNIFVTDYLNSKVYVYNLSGDSLFTFRTDGNPKGICTNRKGQIFVADAANSRVDMYTSRGEFIHTAVNIANPWGIALGPEGDLVVTNVYISTVTIFPRQMLLHGA
ncbi:hypothetical protein Bbelb_130220 [Branchiostoma belcheri]|nr:hypothetical protein Bbelb_130220 [Branchiostoma belcheri]